MGSIVLAVANQRQERLGQYGYINTAILEKNYEGRGIPHIASRAYRAVWQPAVAILSRLEGAYQYIYAKRVTVGWTRFTRCDS